jgi:hypothetical protein
MRNAFGLSSFRVSLYNSSDPWRQFPRAPEAATI